MYGSINPIVAVGVRVCVVPTHPHRPHQRSSCRGSRWRGPRRKRTGWCGSAIFPCRGPPSGPGRPAWPSAAGHSSRGVRLAASWMAVSCPPRQIHLTPKRRVKQEPRGAHTDFNRCKNLLAASGSRCWRLRKILLLFCSVLDKMKAPEVQNHPCEVRYLSVGCSLLMRLSALINDIFVYAFINWASICGCA